MYIHNYDCRPAGKRQKNAQFLVGWLLSLFVFVQVQAQSPGGVSTNLKLWLKADAGTNTTTNGGAVSQWDDQGPDLTKRNATQTTAGNQPSYKDGTAGINFNPAISFDGSNDYLENASGGFYSQQYYLVLVNHELVNSTTQGKTPLSGEKDPQTDVTGFHLGASTNRFTNEVVSHLISNQSNWGRAFISTTASIPVNATNLFSVRNTAANTGTNIYQNGKQIDNADNNAHQDATDTPYKIGATRTFLPNTYFNGKVAEIITFSARNSDADKSKIESYLALKYGIHLETDYVSSTGTTIWDKDVNTAYHHDVTGIGRDDNATLLQKQSASSNDATLAIGLTSIASTNALNTNAFPVNNSFLIWGHNNLSTGIATTVTPQLKRMARIWKVANAGNITDVMVRVSNSYFTGPVTESPVLIISNDATIDANDQVIDLQKSGSYQQKLTTLPDGAYFTFGIQNVPPLMIPISYTKN